MSTANWRNVFTYNKFTQIAARAVRQSLKEEKRVAAEKRGLTALRYQNWENGQGSDQIVLNSEEHKKAEAAKASSSS